MEIRRAVLADIDAIESLWNELMDFHAAIDDYFLMNADAGDSHRPHMRGLIQDEKKRVFVAEDHGQLLGYLVAEFREYPPIYLLEKYGHIGAISVTTSARRKGVGRSLVTTALDWFKEEGIRRVECGVAVGNPVSQSFWKGLGFRGCIEKHVLDFP